MGLLDKPEKYIIYKHNIYEYTMRDIMHAIIDINDVYKYKWHKCSKIECTSLRLFIEHFDFLKECLKRVYYLRPIYIRDFKLLIDLLSYFKCDMYVGYRLLKGAIKYYSKANKQEIMSDVTRIYNDMNVCIRKIYKSIKILEEGYNLSIDYIKRKNDSEDENEVLAKNRKSLDGNLECAKLTSKIKEDFYKYIILSDKYVDKNNKDVKRLVDLIVDQIYTVSTNIIFANSIRVEKYTDYKVRHESQEIAHKTSMFLLFLLKDIQRLSNGNININPDSKDSTSWYSIMIEDCSRLIMLLKAWTEGDVKLYEDKFTMKEIEKRASVFEKMLLKNNITLK